MRFGKFLIGATGLAMTLGVSAVRADLATLQITDPNTAVAPYPGPYAAVSISRTSTTTATLTFMSLSTASNYFLMGSEAVADLNINATSFTVGTITSGNLFAGFTPGPVFNDGSGNVSAFGDFNLTLKSFDGYTHSNSTITLDVTSTGGPLWLTAADVLQDNADGYMAAAHIFVTPNPPNVNDGALATGFSAGGGATNVVTTPVPVPTALLSGLGLLGLLAIRRMSTSA